jgi:aldose 1-epimerase
MIKEYEENNLKFIKVSNEFLTVTFCNLGAAIYSIIFNNKEMLLVPKDLEDYSLNNIYHGKTIGRTANRIKGSIIKIDGKTYELEENEFGNTLHGGVNGLSTKTFKYKVKETNNSIKVIFNRTSKDQESGFPGKLKTLVSYSLHKNKPELKIDFKAKTDSPTLCDLTNHAYFNLGEASVKNLSLKIISSKYLQTTTNELLPVTYKDVFEELDFRKFKRIKKGLKSPLIKQGKANGYDHYLKFDEINKKPQITLKSKDVQLKISTDFAGVQIYTDNYVDDIEYLNTHEELNRGIAIEPMDDYLNRKILRPNEKYKRYIKYKFNK